MDKFEYQAKLEEINKLVEKQEYDEAVKIADTIEWKRVRSVRTLCMVSEIYEVVGRAEDSKAILYRAYRRSPNSRQILYRLTEVCVLTQDFDDAVEYYTEYVNLSPNDNSKYILKYEIYKGRGSSLEEQIAVLEEYRSKEYTEQWAYELAKLYDEAGMTDKCVAECDDLALWFHNGKYVVQALELKKKYAPLTPEQQTVYDNPSEIVDMETKEAVVEKAVPTLDEVITKELPKSEKDAIADSIIMDTEKQIAAAVQSPEMKMPELKIPEAKVPEVKVPEIKVPQDNGAAQEATQASQNPKHMSTVELQSELASSMREILSGIRPASVQEELESAPVITHTAPAEEEEEQIPHQMSIDDLLTGEAAEPATETKKAPTETVREEKKEAAPAVDALTAPTIDLSKKIEQEIGNVSIRNYAAALSAAEKESAERISDTKTFEKPEAAAAEEREPAVQESATKEENSAAAPEQKPAQEPVAAAPEMAEVPQSGGQMQESAAQEPESDEDQVDPTKADAKSYAREEMDEKEKAMMGFWSTIRGMNEQINLAVTSIMRSILTDKTSNKGNVLLVGDAGNGRTTLAISMAKIISRCKGQQVAKVAKIYAEDLNEKDIAATVSKMAGGVLIIEEAGDLSDQAVAQLTMAMQFKTESLVVVLEDERRYLQDLLARNPQFAQKFDVTINVPMLTNDELVEFGKYYALQNDCVLDESGVTSLYDGVAAMQSPEQPVAILDVKEIVDKAVRHANRFGLGKIFSSISGKRYDENDRVILRAKNFKKIK